MTYKEWAEQYYESARVLSERIEIIKQQMKTASSDTLKELSSRAELFRIMRMECIETARLLGSRKGEC